MKIQIWNRFQYVCSVQCVHLTLDDSSLLTSQTLQHSVVVESCCMQFSVQIYTEIDLLRAVTWDSTIFVEDWIFFCQTSTVCYHGIKTSTWRAACSYNRRHNFIFLTMVVLWLILLASTVMANADLSLEQLKLQYKSEEAEHLQQTLEVKFTLAMFDHFSPIIPSNEKSICLQ